MRNITTIKNKYKPNELTVVLNATYQAPQKISQITPYALLQLWQKTIIEYQIETILSVYPSCELLIIVGYDAHKIFNQLKTLKKKNVRLIYNPNFDSTNSLYNLGLGLFNNTNDNVLYIDGINLFDKNTISDLNTKESIAVVDESLNDKNIGVTINNNIIEFFSGDLYPKWANIIFLNTPELRKIEEYAINPRFYNRYIYEAINLIIDNNAIIKPKNINCNLLQISKIDDLQKARKIFK